MAAAATSYLFRVAGDGELAAPLIPAISGVALIAVLWLMRSLHGAAGALATGVLVAFSPLFIVSSRSATAFSVGALVAVVMTVSLFAYLREPGPWRLLPLVVSIALAPLTDALAVTALLAVLAFLVLEAAVFRSHNLSKAWTAFRRSPLSWLSTLLVIAAAAQLAITHFGTSLERSWPGESSNSEKCLRLPATDASRSTALRYC